MRVCYSHITSIPAPAEFILWRGAFRRKRGHIVADRGRRAKARIMMCPIRGRNWFAALRDISLDTESVAPGTCNIQLAVVTRP